ncbi:ubiquitin carboxyl-terminal hydrolase MINDY-1 [Eurytemora carolleeae]|uniref:ubiquitin carboxyl-terminal hydrolase MINDY-1 n=1 Tax=Eurytemora carolleeae TaxID=1294199 RepID=UPI000C77D35A|nr:ubiquitin carboxyl-terminal hydrolase MINDY-1 [Eurytemora carolleeae]|eukprot:XP_023345436.1 ubiquitin carboxyl-terminal hydrolase MINDY-1-like [Eurytemora affinis]
MFSFILDKMSSKDEIIGNVCVEGTSRSTLTDDEEHMLVLDPSTSNESKHSEESSSAINSIDAESAKEESDPVISMDDVSSLLPATTQSSNNQPFLNDEDNAKENKTEHSISENPSQPAGNHIGPLSLSSTDIIQSQSALGTENVADQMESLETNPQSPEISLVEENPSETDRVPVSIEPTKLDDNNDKSEFNVNSSSTLGISPSNLRDSAVPSNLEDSVVPSILKDGVVSSTLEDPVSPCNLEDPVVPSNLEEAVIPSNLVDPVIPSNLENPVIPSNLEDPVIPSNLEDPAVPSPRGGPAADEEDGFNKDKNIYAVKWIEFGLRSSAIITQNENGPCPLISIVNILLLRGKLSLPEGAEVVCAEQLLEYLGDLILSLSTSKEDLDLERNINDAVAVLPKLSTGLDVNVKFTGVDEFEYTSELLIFDILHINLYHGWLVDPQKNLKTFIHFRLYELTAKLEELELAVFFRNNHFSTLFKKNGELFILVTDQGFLSQKEVVWETLANIEGDCSFVNSTFKDSGVDSRLENCSAAANPAEALEQEYVHISSEWCRRLAEVLQREGEEATQREQLFQEFKQNHLGGHEQLTDGELAARLQEAENAAAQEDERSAQGPQGAPGPEHPIGPRGGKKEKNCCIL